MKCIRLAVADDHALLRESLSQVLATYPGIEIAAQLASGAEAIKYVLSNTIDCLILDMDLTDKTGIEVIKAIRRDNKKLPILVLSMHPENLYAIRALKAGASGYITKSSSTQELVTAIRQVASNAKYVSTNVAELLASQMYEKTFDGEPHESLSDREYQYLVMTASGLTLSQIAAQMNLSTKTISMFRSRALKKMGMKTNAELAHYAIRNNIVT
ncbi:response regulator transcription factor [Polynucleobacter paneuropaeus]|nr:response regulator transcription factor [Polynucleobacter paneuropaeus]QWD05669.1 response regulator transcription factor [Polynucleobacter paneuropaeus]QWD07469.1 response regulator transcription factor [Polynucleobacter paneuropaeus]QWD49339.1 response regulator transcription factor [Polynucleobacter paneuropaeus]